MSDTKDRYYKSPSESSQGFHFLPFTARFLNKNNSGSSKNGAIAKLYKISAIIDNSPPVCFPGKKLY